MASVTSSASEKQLLRRTNLVLKTIINMSIGSAALKKKKITLSLNIFVFKIILSLITYPLSPKIKPMQMLTVYANVSKLTPPPLL